jgi:hypothetical protein
MIGSASEEPKVEERTYGTINADFIRLREWLPQEGSQYAEDFVNRRSRT